MNDCFDTYRTNVCARGVPPVAGKCLFKFAFWSNLGYKPELPCRIDFMQGNYFYNKLSEWTGVTNPYFFLLILSSSALIYSYMRFRLALLFGTRELIEVDGENSIFG